MKQSLQGKPVIQGITRETFTLGDRSHLVTDLIPHETLVSFTVLCSDYSFLPLVIKKLSTMLKLFIWALCVNLRERCHLQEVNPSAKNVSFLFMEVNSPVDSSNKPSN